MYQRRFINCKKCTIVTNVCSTNPTLVGVVEKGGGYACVGPGVIWEISYFSFSFLSAHFARKMATALSTVWQSKRLLANFN